MSHKLFLSAALALALAGCSKTADDTAATPAAADAGAVTTAIAQVEDAQIAALNAKDAAGAAAPYAADATVYLTGQEPVTGTEAIKGMFVDSLEDPAYAVTADEGSAKSWVADSGDMAVTSFTGTWTRTVDGAAKTDRLANQTLWAKQPDGTWKIASDFNMTLPGGAPAEPMAPPAAESGESPTPSPAPNPTPQ